MVRRILPILVRSLADLWDNLLVLVIANALWALSAMPGLAFLFLGGSVLAIVAMLVGLVLLVGPATMSLYYITADVNRRERVELREYLRGIRRYYRRGWALAALNAVFAIIAYFNFIFYSSKDVAGSPIALLSVIWLYLAVVWFTFQIYMWPLALRMEKLKIGLLLRNSALATFKYPFFGLVLALFLLLLLILSFFTAFVVTIIFGAVFQALVSNRALGVVLEQEEARSTGQNSTTVTGLAMNVPPPLEKKAPAPEEVTEAIPTRNTPVGVKQRGTSITRTLNTDKRKKD